jgi:wyosine [tRNA(Phe)-imidazoG37] synthetase (radical SAM superfamily)
MIIRTPQHAFGPVWSRRLGRSLGIDLVPFKTCTYDCIYCQLGGTTNKTATRLEYVPLDAVIADAAHRLASGPAPDYVTLSGSGEPTLHARVGELIPALRRLTDRPIAVLTNGSLLWDPEVRHSLLKADLVLPSLDAGDESLFQRVNRPLPGLSLEQVVDGLTTFRQQYTGQIWLEVLLLAGLSAVPEQVERIAQYARQIAPDRVQLNTVARPPAEVYAQPAATQTLSRLATRFSGKVEVIAPEREEDPAPAGGTASAFREEKLLSLIERRPVTVDDIARGLGWPHAEVIKCLHQLVCAGKVTSSMVREAVFFRPSGRG